MILLPFAADFRWMRQRDDTPWYPTAKLLRQSALGDWDSVIVDLGDELRQMNHHHYSSATGIDHAGS